MDPLNCLTTEDPAAAKMFYVQFFSDIEYRIGEDGLQKDLDRKTTPFSSALMDAMTGKDYSNWEKTWGHTSKYWENYGGADHFVVVAAPLSGFEHPTSKRGSFHFINTQLQLTRTIVTSVELSQTFLNDYPKCASKNIVVPYMNHDGEWLRGDILNAVVPNDTDERVYPGGRQTLMFYRGGNHGECVPLRKMLNKEYECSSSSSYFRTVTKSRAQPDHAVGLSSAVFCSTPHGDSPSAKRMYDASDTRSEAIVLLFRFVCS